MNNEYVQGYISWDSNRNPFVKDSVQFEDFEQGVKDRQKDEENDFKRD